MDQGEINIQLLNKISNKGIVTNSLKLHGYLIKYIEFSIHILI